jgi:hypothetical protein
LSSANRYPITDYRKNSSFAGYLMNSQKFYDPSISILQRLTESPLGSFKLKKATDILFKFVENMVNKKNYSYNMGKKGKQL